MFAHSKMFISIASETICCCSLGCNCVSGLHLDLHYPFLLLLRQINHLRLIRTACLLAFQPRANGISSVQGQSGSQIWLFLHAYHPTGFMRTMRTACIALVAAALERTVLYRENSPYQAARKVAGSAILTSRISMHSYACLTV